MAMAASPMHRPSSEQQSSRVLVSRGGENASVEMIHHEQQRRRGFMRCVALLLLAFLLLLQAWLASTLSDDGLALLAFKDAVKPGAMKVFDNWDEKDRVPCSWTGVSCSPDYRVVGLNISGASMGSCGGGILDRRNSWTLQSHLDASSSSLCSTNNTNLYTCFLGGTLSPQLANLTELRSLVLPFNLIQGSIPKEIGKLKNLQVLELQHNLLSGEIPRELAGLSRLEVLNLEANFLEDNIPDSLSSCQSLVQLNLGHNKLSEAIPPALSNLRRLRQLVLSSNQLNKQVPPELELICGTLEHLDLGRNFFIGDIPPWLGNCSKLRVLVLKSNYLRGVIPVELGRLTLLELLDVSMNRLTGRIPDSLANCRQLSFLVFTNLPGCLPPFTCSSKTVDKVEFNQFSGPLPEGIAALAALEVLWAPRANLTGDIPSVWSSKVKSLNLAENSLTGQFPKALGSCQDLRYLDLSSNQLEGQLPAEIPISCMAVFNVSMNRLSGQIPAAAAGARCVGGYSAPSSDAVSSVICPKLGLSRSSSSSSDDVLSPERLAHDLSSNRFEGPVPAPLVGEASVSTLYLLRLSDNQLSGNLSSLLSSCDRFGGFSLNVSHNAIEGKLNFGACTSFVDLDASNNRISGTLPTEIGELQNLTHLDLSHNQLQGAIPGQLGRLWQLQALVLANNSLGGTIPDELGNATSLELLDLSRNSIQGEIPAALGRLSSLELLILNNNKLSGRIPVELTQISALTAVDLANNNLSGTIPQRWVELDLCDNTSFAGNSYLQPCTSVSSPAPGDMDQITNPATPPPGDSGAAAADSGKGGSHKLSLIVIVAITSGAAIACVLFVLAMLVQCTRQRLPGHRVQNLRRGMVFRGGGADTGNHRHHRRKKVTTFTSVNFALTYDSVVRATGNFGVDYLIGTGGFGATYKAELTPGSVVAVKRLALGRFQGVQQVQQFHTEIRTLGRIRHPNLVTLIGYHASETEMFLIYNYFPRGNLDSFIRNRCGGDMSWQVVHKIALGIAEALAYLHDDCVPRVLHRDIKPSNILLDNSLTAYLADFGLARLLAASETHATTDVAGTFGYVAPEYAMTCRVSDKADVYSYGVVLLELLSGKRALDTAFSEFGHGFNIVAWASLLIGQGRASQVFIVELWETGPQEHLLEVLKLAVMCTVDSLVIRPGMKQVVERLRNMS